MSDYDKAFESAVKGDDKYADAWKSATSAPAPQKAEPVSDFSGTLRVGPVDTRIPLPEFINKALAQFGSGAADYGLRIQQMMGNATPNDAAEKRARDAVLNDGIVGKGLAFAGKAAPMMAMPMSGAAPILSSMASGALGGALEPVGPGESAAFNTALGGVLGGVVPGVIQGVRKVLTPADITLAEKAINQHQIPLSPSDITGSKAVKAARSILDDVPVTGAMGAAQKEAKQIGFNRAVGSTFGAAVDKLDDATMTAAKGRIGGELDRVWNNNNFKMDGQFITDLQTQMNRATNLNPEQQAAVSKHVQNLLSKVNQNGEIPGSFVNNWQSELRLVAEGDKGLAQDILNKIRQSTIQGFNRNVSGPDAAALATARAQYKAFKTVQPIINKADAGVAGRVAGDVPAALLPGAVVNSYGKASGTPFEDLSQIAGRYMVDRTPQTGGSVRALLQNAGMAGVGAGAIVAPVATAAGVGSGVGLQGLLSSPTVAKWMLSQPQVRGLLDSPSMMAATKELGMNSLYRLPVPVGLGLLSLPATE